MNRDNRIRWACRRGMLELDLFLIPFFDHQFETLNPAEQRSFQTLLTASDPELLAWFMANETPPNKELSAIVDKIRQFKFKHSASTF